MHAGLPDAIDEEAEGLGQRRSSSADCGSRRYRSESAIWFIRSKAPPALISPPATAMHIMSIVSRVVMCWNFAYRTEAREIADHLCDGDTLTAALRVVAPGRRSEVRSLLSGMLGTHHGFDRSGAGRDAVVAVLRAIEGARSAPTTIDPLWTMPGHLAQHGRLTQSVSYLVDNARYSVVCSTFNFQRSSGLWEALRRAVQRPEISMKVYVDTHAADSGERRAWSRPQTSSRHT